MRVELYDIEQYSRSIIDEVIQMKATDVHFVPMPNKCLMTYRLNGKLEHWKELLPSLADRLISHFKYQSGMDIGERRKPQSSSMIHLTKSSSFSLRLSTLPTKDKESLAIRILPHLSSKALPSLSVLQHSRNTLFEVSKMPRGLCLLSGPTGSGKSTTLYAIIEQIIREGGRSIITIEDPIERPIPTIIQVEVNMRAGMSFDTVLKASLRHDPDVILIGEIRDEITASLAVRAALTGHLVLATVHASSCYAALLRMLDLGVSKLDLSECCKMVLSQQLVQIKCPICQGFCDRHCERYRTRSRAALFEVLKGKALSEAFVSRKAGAEWGFKAAAKKAWALGYLSDDEMLRVINE